jgi:SEC-C motif domain protein
MPQTPDALMRSRFSAYALQSSRYLLDTWHPSTRPLTISFESDVEWLTLKIKSATLDGDSGTVAFVAKFREAGTIRTLEETSHFVRENGAWLYVNGIVN